MHASLRVGTKMVRVSTRTTVRAQERQGYGHKNESMDTGTLISVLRAPLSLSDVCGSGCILD